MTINYTTIIIAVAAALVGGAATYTFTANDPEMKELLRRSVELKEQELAARAASAERAKKFFGGTPAPTTGGIELKPNWGKNQ